MSDSSNTTNVRVKPLSRLFFTGKSSSAVDKEIDFSLNVSPVTDLTLNLKVLSTTGKEHRLARRKLSLSASPSENYFSDSVNSAAASRSENVDKQYSVDSGCCVDVTDCSNSPTVDDSPFLQQLSVPVASKSQGSSFRRLQSLPLPSLGIVPTPPSGRILSRLYKSDSGTIDGVACCSAVTPNKQRSSTAIQDKENIIDKNDLVASLFKFPSSPVLRGTAFADSTNRNAWITKRSFSLVESHLESSCSPSLSESSQRSYVGYPKNIENLFFSPVIEANENIDAGYSGEFSGTKENIYYDADRQGGLHDSFVSRSGQETGQGLFRTPSVPNFSRAGCPVRSNLRMDGKGAVELSRRRFCFKRSESQREDHVAPIQNNKRRRSTTTTSAAAVDDDDAVESDNKAEDNVVGTTALVVEKSAVRGRLSRCHSDAELTIKTALSWADTQQDLIGDFSKPYCLPLIQGKHQDLRAISTQTLADIMNQDFKHIVEKYVIIDSRYPYEFEGGHIEGAKNLYMKNEILAEFFTSPQHRSSGSSNMRTVFVFHCEFSSQRGPELSRFLRNTDRDLNRDSYPSLHYPEIYILEGGYKAFYDSHPHLCSPRGYVPMMHQDHLDDLKHFRSKSSSWTSQKNRTSAASRALRLKM